MKRFGHFIALIALSSPAHADSFSFAVAGRSIRIESPRHCHAASCVSVSIPGIYRSKRWRDRDDEGEVAPAPAPVSASARGIVPVAAPAAPASQSPVQPAALAPPPPAPPPAPAPITVLAAPLPNVEPLKTIPVEAPPVVASAPIPVPAPPIAEVAQQTEHEPADTPIGDWQTEGNKGTVRIERCGEAMCGYVLALTPNAKGDTVLINMKPNANTVKSSTVWSGNIYSRSSGGIYHATMTLKATNTLRVEACALGRFFCSGNDWTRSIAKPDKLITSQMSPRPTS